MVVTFLVFRVTTFFILIPHVDLIFLTFFCILYIKVTNFLKHDDIYLYKANNKIFPKSKNNIF